MSHYAITKVKIKNPDMNILKIALDRVMKRYEAKMTNEITDYYGAKRKVEMGVVSKHFPRGIEIRINQKTKELEIGGDFYGFRNEVQSFVDDLSMEYTAEATRQSLVAMGYSMQRQEIKDGNKVKEVVLSGVQIGGW